MNGTIYAAFGAFCDFKGTVTRGWLLGWSGLNLAPLPTNQLNDAQASSPTNWFLSGIWQSGYGIAGGFDAGNGGAPSVMFTTGNSDCNFYVSPELCPPASTYDGVTNIQESIVKTDSGITQISGIFSPPKAAILAMDKGDLDVSSGGVMMLPTQSGSYPDLAVQAGKTGSLVLLNRDDMSQPLELAPSSAVLVRAVLLCRLGWRSAHRHQPGKLTQHVATVSNAVAPPPAGGSRRNPA